MTDLNGARIWLTGASTGIGEAPSRGALARRGRMVGAAIVAVILGAALLWRAGRVGRPAYETLGSLKNSGAAIDEVVFIVVDTLRADSLSIYEGAESATPFLSELARHAVIFERAISGSSSTAPAMASVFTARYPSRHGVFTGLMAHRHLAETHTSMVLGRIPAAFKTLGEYFSSNGFEARGAADNLNIGKDLGFARGFQSFDTFRDEGAPRINQVTKDWTFTGRKRFSYIHYMEPHSPYRPREPWFRKSDQKRQRIKNAYESEIAYIDSEIRALVEHHQWDKRALIVFLSDHGEEFWDHKRTGHGRTLYSEVTRVPFFIYHPALATVRVRETVHTIDILPTVAELLGWPADPEWEGVSLLRPEAYGRPVFSELLRRPEHGRFERTAVFHEDHALILTHREPERIELYNLRTDLLQQHDLTSADPERRDRLLAHLDNHRARPAGKVEDVTVTIDTETNKALKTLGYLQ